jgi:hypothetical protein
MTKKIIKRNVTTRLDFRFAHVDIRRIIRDIHEVMGPERRTDFMVLAFGVMQYHGKCRDLRDLTPEHYDAVGFAFMKKLIELRKVHA